MNSRAEVGGASSFSFAINTTRHFPTGSVTNCQPTSESSFILNIHQLAPSLLQVHTGYKESKSQVSGTTRPDPFSVKSCAAVVPLSSRRAFS